MGHARVSLTACSSAHGMYGDLSLTLSPALLPLQAFCSVPPHVPGLPSPNSSHCGSRHLHACMLSSCHGDQSYTCDMPLSSLSKPTGTLNYEFQWNTGVNPRITMKPESGSIPRGERMVCELSYLPHAPDRLRGYPITCQIINGGFLNALFFMFFCLGTAWGGTVCDGISSETLYGTPR